MDEGSCADCRAGQARSAPRPDFGALWEASQAELGPWIQARWDGSCRGCGGRIEAGEYIRFCPAEDGYLCSVCGTEQAARLSAASGGGRCSVIRPAPCAVPGGK